MDIILKERNENSVLLVLKGIDIGFLTLLVSELIKDKRVLNAYSKKPHILLEENELFILCAKGHDPIEILQEKIENIKKDYQKIKKNFESIFNVQTTKA